MLPGFSFGALRAQTAGDFRKTSVFLGVSTSRLGAQAGLADSSGILCSRRRFLQAGGKHQQIVVEVAVSVGADVGLFALGADHHHDGTLAGARIQDKKSVVAGFDAANDLSDGPLPSVSAEVSDVLVGTLGVGFS